MLCDNAARYHIPHAVHRIRVQPRINRPALVRMRNPGTTNRHPCSQRIPGNLANLQPRNIRTMPSQAMPAPHHQLLLQATFRQRTHEQRSLAFATTKLPRKIEMADVYQRLIPDKKEGRLMAASGYYRIWSEKTVYLTKGSMYHSASSAVVLIVIV